MLIYNDPMARISEQSIERVRNSADIVEVISAYVDLKQRGRNFLGLCPFHNEKTPSFSVSPDKQIYKCFGCGVGGGSINFIMEKENLEFVDAIKTLAQRFNIELEITGGDNKMARDLKSQLLAIHELANNHFQNLLHSTDKGKKALAYLKERGLSNDIIKMFNVGFSSDYSDELLKKIQDENFSSEAMKQSGLFIESEKGYYDRFRSRIMFPVKNHNGNVIAFGGRIFDKDNPAKYVNSPETPIYVKSNVLYGSDINGPKIREEKKLILVEGYMDLLQLVQAGITNCLAISGTAFTTSHANLMKRYAKDVYITFDGDFAGKKAAIRCGYILAANSIEASIITPPKDLDPDDWVRQDGGKGLLSELENGKDIISSHYTFFSEENEEGSLSANEFIQECLNELMHIENPIIIDLMIKRLSELTSVDQKNISMVLQDKLDKKNAFKSRSQDIEESEPSVKIKEKFSIQLYDDLIRLCCVKDSDIRKLIFNSLNVDWILSDQHKAIYDQIFIHLKSEEEPPISIISEQITNKEARQKFIDLTFDIEKINPSRDMAIDCLVRLEQAIMTSQVNNIREKLKQDSSGSQDILAQLLNLEKEILNLKDKYNE